MSVAKNSLILVYCAFSLKESEDKITIEELQHAQDVMNVLAGFTVNLTDFPQLAMKCGNTGLIPVFLEMTEALKDSILDMIPFEVRVQPLCFVKTGMHRELEQSSMWTKWLFVVCAEQAFKNLPNLKLLCRKWNFQVRIEVKAEHNFI